MMLEQLHPKHFNTMVLQGNLQESQSVFSEAMENEAYQMQLCAHPGYAATHQGVVLAMGGVMPFWQGRVFGWMLMGDNLGRRMAVVHRYVSRFLDEQDADRIETVVLDGFDAGHRWAQMLGFEWEGLMKKWGADGCDYHLYARVR
jgi:hypothetical protein